MDQLLAMSIVTIVLLVLLAGGAFDPKLPVWMRIVGALISILGLLTFWSMLLLEYFVRMVLFG
jgi:hypothetical protein